MHGKRILGMIILIIAIFTFYLFATRKTEVNPQNVLSFEDCVAAGYPVAESYPRQCKTPDGRTYAEELPPPPITYNNASVNLIVVETPPPGAVVGKEFSIMGRARGMWFFEASFPVTILDENGDPLVVSYATAQGEWMTENFVPFKSDIKAPASYIGPATVVLHRDNASGLPEHDASITYPIVIEY